MTCYPAVWELQGSHLLSETHLVCMNTHRLLRKTDASGEGGRGAEPSWSGFSGRFFSWDNSCQTRAEPMPAAAPVQTLKVLLIFCGWNVLCARWSDTVLMRVLNLSPECWSWTWEEPRKQFLLLMKISDTYLLTPTSTKYKPSTITSHGGCSSLGNLLSKKLNH